VHAVATLAAQLDEELSYSDMSPSLSTKAVAACHVVEVFHVVANSLFRTDVAVRQLAAAGKLDIVGVEQFRAVMAEKLVVTNPLFTFKDALTGRGFAGASAGGGSEGDGGGGDVGSSSGGGGGVDARSVDEQDRPAVASGMTVGRVGSCPLPFDADHFDRMAAFCEDVGAFRAAEDERC
jgi:hypothetical protein